MENKFALYDNTIKHATTLFLGNEYDWRLLKAQYFQESRLDPLAVSDAGATGVGQFISSAWTQWTKVSGYSGCKRTDPIASIHTGAAYMHWLIGQWKWERPQMDRLLLAMASYNAGLGNILKAQKLQGDPSLYADIMKGLPMITGRKKSNETITYGRRILGFYNNQLTGVRLR